MTTLEQSQKKKVGIKILKRLFYIMLIILFAYWTKPYWEDSVQEVIPEELSNSVNHARDYITQLIDFDRLNDENSDFYSPLFESSRENEQDQVEKPELTTPAEQSFSIGNVKLGDTKEHVEQIHGKPMRKSENDYGVEWIAYHENYQNFLMVAYDDEEIVRGLFTNQDLVASQYDIAVGDPKTFVNETLDEPVEVISNGWYNYQINREEAYDVYHLDQSYVTIFYDLHEEERVTAIQLIDEELEAKKETLYRPSSEALRKGLEFQLFDLINATRVNHALSILEWNEQVSETARKHSADMAENYFFSHTNLEEQSPFDRLQEDRIYFTTAGENLAYGQFSSIFAHQGLMNSLGHRENILHENFTQIGIGVDFNEDNHPFYTEKFLSQ